LLSLGRDRVLRTDVRRQPLPRGELDVVVLAPRRGVNTARAVHGDSLLGEVLLDGPHDPGVQGAACVLHQATGVPGAQGDVETGVPLRAAHGHAALAAALA